MNRLRIKILLIGLLSIGKCYSVNAQEGFGTSAPHPESVIELLSSNKGLLLPRIALTGLDLAAPLINHVTGMLVYNTANAGLAANAVSPGYYFNNGTKWIRLQYNAQKAWNNVVTGQAASANNQDIYQSAKVGIGTASPEYALDILGDGTNDPLLLKDLQIKDNSIDNKILMINNTTGVLTYTDVPPPVSFVAQNITGSQIFDKASFSATSAEANASVLTFSNVLILANFGTFSGNSVLTISEAGDYDILASCNLLLNNTVSYYTGAADNAFMNVTVAIQLKPSGGSWASIGSLTNTLNFSSFGLISTLKPVSALRKLAIGDELRVVIYRGAGISLLTGATTIAPQTDANQNGIIQDKFLKVTKYN